MMMMLHIKLPKGKVAAACERAAEMITRRIVVENGRYRRSVESWQMTTAEIVTALSKERDRLQTMADMAKHSVGDVYVSQELWRTIKEVYV